MNLVTIDTAPGNMSMYIAPNNTKYLELGKNASTTQIGPLTQNTGAPNVSTFINGIRVDSNSTNNNLIVTASTNKYSVNNAPSTNVCNTIVSNIAFTGTTPMTGDHCTAVGHNCLTNNTSGKYNIAIGADTLTNVTYGNYNTAVGGMALMNTTTSSNNVAVGYNALGSNTTATYGNVAVGYQALQNSTGIGGNTAIGYQSLGGLTTGIGNTAIGYISGNSPGVATINTTGNDNVIIGTDATSNNKNRTIVIGHGAYPNNDDEIILGKATGAHTTWIQGTGGLQVRGPTKIYEATGTYGGASGSGSLVIDHGNTGGSSSIIFTSRNNYTSDHGYIRFRDDVNNGTGESARLEIGVENDSDDHVVLQKGSGLVGIGTSSPGYKLDVNGDARASRILTTGFNSFQAILHGYVNVNTGSGGGNQNVTLPSLSTGSYIVAVGSNYGDPNVLMTVDVVIIGNTVCSAVIRNANSTSSAFLGRISGWSGQTFFLNCNFPSNYNSFSVHYYPVCLF